MKIQGTHHYPDIEITFTTERGELVAREGRHSGNLLHNEVLSVSTSNDLQTDAGTFQIVLANRHYWERMLASNDLVTIRMYRDYDKENPETPTVMIGLIDDIRRTVSINDNTVQRNIVITGRSFSKVLMNFEVGAVNETDINLADLGWLQGRITFIGMSASDILKQLFDKVVFKYMDYEFKDSERIKDKIKLDLKSRPNEFLSDETSFINYQGSMQAFVKEVINEPFNQMFWEYYDRDRATLVVRETPFNPANWKALYTHILHDEDVLNDSTGRSDVEAYTLFSVGSQNFYGAFDINKTLGVFPLWYEPHFKKYGIKRLHRLTAYAFTREQANEAGTKAGNGEGSGTGDTDTAMESRTTLETYQKDLFNWNINNASFYNGFLMIKGNSKYKIGDRLIYESKESNKEIEFYIESVSHEFQKYGTWITKLGVTRGVLNRGKGRFDAPWDEYEEYDGTALGGPSIEEMRARQQELVDEVGNRVNTFFSGNGAPPGGAGTFTGVGDPQAIDLGRVTYKYAPNGSAEYAKLGFNGGRHYGTDFNYIYASVKTPISGRLTKRFITGGGLTAFIQNGNTHVIMMHMSSIIAEGEVSAGQVIGKTGNTGTWTTGPHLHLQVQEGTTAINQGTIDPEGFLRSLKARGGGAMTVPPSEVEQALEQAITGYALTFIDTVTYAYGSGYTPQEREAGLYDNASWVIEVLNRTGASDITQPLKSAQLARQGRAVTVHDARPGDLIFFDTAQKNGSVGIWLTDDTFIMCSSDGVKVRYLHDVGWAKRFNGVLRRYIGKKEVI